MDQYMGQLMVVPYAFAPKGWAFCQGQLLPISQNSALYALLGTQYGGDGRTTFALPNLKGNMAIGIGQGPGQPNYYQGGTGGETSVTLTQQQMPAHNHQQMGTNTLGTAFNPKSTGFASTGAGKGQGQPYYIAASGSTATLNATALQLAGGSQAHPNQMPYLELNYIICMQGVFPQRP